jgi:osmoprotectant transport system permease protein
VPSPSLSDYLRVQWPYIRPLFWEQIQLVLLTMVIAALIGITIGALVWDRPRISGPVMALAGALLTIPSLALLTLLQPATGLGWTTTVIALVVYAQLPIIRNTVAGLRSVDPAVTQAAAGIGMGPIRRLIRVQLPLAWPVILAGLRVATMLVFGISAIAAYVSGPGLGNLVFTGLSRLGSVNATNQAVVGAFGIAGLALAFDAVYLVLRRVTVSRGIRV